MIDERKFLDAINDVMVGNFDSALEKYKALINENPEDPQVWYGLAQVQRFKKNFTDSLQSITRAVKLAPKNKDYLLFKIQLLYRMNKKLDAREMATNIVSKHPYFMEAWFFYLNILSELKDVGGFRSEFKEMFKIATKFPPAKSKEAIGKYFRTPMVTNDYYYDDVLEYRIMVGDKSKRSGKSKILIFETYSDSLKFFFNPKNADKYDQLSYPVVLVSQKFPFPVPERQRFENEPEGRQIEIAPHEINERLRKNGNLPIQLQKKSLQSKSTLTDKAKLFLERRKPRKALDLLLAALAKDSKYYFANWYCSYAYWMLEDYEKAEELFQIALDQNPSQYAPYTEIEIVRLQGQIHSHRAYMFHILGEYKKAISDYDAATRFNPDDYLCWAYKAECLKEMEDLKEARECNEEAKRLYNIMLS